MAAVRPTGLRRPDRPGLEAAAEHMPCTAPLAPTLHPLTRPCTYLTTPQAARGRPSAARMALGDQCDGLLHSTLIAGAAPPPAPEPTPQSTHAYPAPYHLHPTSPSRVRSGTRTASCTRWARTAGTTTARPPTAAVTCSSHDSHVTSLRPLALSTGASAGNARLRQACRES